MTHCPSTAREPFATRSQSFRLALLLTITMIAAPLADAAVTCESLASVQLPNVHFTLAQNVPAGSFQAPGGRGGGGQGVAAGRGATPRNRHPVSLAGAGLGLGNNGGRPNAAFMELAAFCRVTATLMPTPTSDIRVELWLPDEGWNHRFIGTSPNGLGGAIPYPSMANAIRDGYAVVGEDTGHRTAEAHWMDDQERRKDFGYRAIHEATVFGKALTSRFYDARPSYSYMRECGGGSLAALSEVQNYAADYNGVVAGAFPVYLTRQTFGQMWPWQVTHKDAASVIPPAKFSVIHAAVLKQCDALDGVRDGVLENPTRCQWDPREIACKSGDAADCLTAAQVEAVRKVYEGPVNPRTGEKIHSPLFRGSELEWQTPMGPEPLGGGGPVLSFFRDFVFKDPSWDYHSRPLNFDADVARADDPSLTVIDAVKPDISRFVSRGGRLILANGWSNVIVPPGATVEYYNSVQKTIGAKATERGVRLYMVPDMSECNGGDGTDTFDMFAVMRNWVEKRRAPQSVIASRVADDGRVSRTRPLCPYPQVAKYKGTGSTDDAASFICGLDNP
jgi:feruloyl esterase